MDLTDDPIQVQVWGVAPADAVVWIGEERDEVLFRVAQIFDAARAAADAAARNLGWALLADYGDEAEEDEDDD